MTTYETTSGTKPHKMTKHEPRTVERHNSDGDLFMMTEIGDGVFVQWGTCRKCGERVKDCKCPGGPVEPDYMTRWRDQRFERELNARPEPGHEELPQIVAFLRERGYTVTKKGGKAEPEAEPEVAEVDDERDHAKKQDEFETERAIDGGLNAALERVRAVQDDAEDVGF